MVLEYVEYTEMGGTLPRPAFFVYERKAAYLIRAQDRRAGGSTNLRKSRRR